MVLKSASAHWNVSFRIKKTNDLSVLSVGADQEGKSRLREDYEQLRAYALSPVKEPSRPIGLDLWGKKGFLAWSVIILHREAPPVNLTPARTMNHDIPTDLLISLTNILMKWSDENQ